MEYQLGPLEARLLYTLERENVTAFTTSQATTMLGIKEGSTRRLLQRLSAKGRLQRIKRGEYHLIPAKAGYHPRWVEHVFAVLEGMLEEYYIGYWTALNYWGFTEQIPLTVFVASMSRRRPFSYGGYEVKYVLVSKRKFFGWVSEPFGESTFRISDREKTVIDALDLPQNSGGVIEATKGLREDLDWVKLEQYAERMGNGAVSKRLGYLVETIYPSGRDELLERLQKNLSRGYSWLDPTASKTTYATSSRWRLYVNLPRDALRGPVSD